jgi:L-aminopeptidase/D-esterase-like protein
VDGIQVGHYTDAAAATGCTVVLCEGGAVAGVDVRGASPGTRETDLLAPTASVEQVQAVLLTGGSAFGLAAASGVVRFLEERGVGYRAGPFIVPIVPAAVIFDLGVGESTVRPGPEEGYQACVNASDGDGPEGNVGAGTGATVAKVLGPSGAIKGGLGTASVSLSDGVVVGAIVAMNAVGGVFDHETGSMIAGPRTEHGMADPVQAMLTRDTEAGAFASTKVGGGNTIIGVVATNATLTKPQANRMATVAHDGLALAVRPAHTVRDGDTMFGLATGSHPAGDLDKVYAAAVLTVSRAIVRGIDAAQGLHGFPSASDVRGGE